MLRNQGLSSCPIMLVYILHIICQIALMRFIGIPEIIVVLIFAGIIFWAKTIVTFVSRLRKSIKSLLSGNKNDVFKD